MRRVVIDTNCLIASIPPSNEEFWLYLAFKNKEFIWVISSEILSEYEEKLSEFYSEKTADRVLKIILKSTNIELTAPNFKWSLITADPDDNKFADLAIPTNAHFLVSNDRHFNIFKTIKFPPLNVVKLHEFKKILDV